MGTSHTTADYLFRRRFPSISSACVSILRRKYASRVAKEPAAHPQRALLCISPDQHLLRNVPLTVLLLSCLGWKQVYSRNSTSKKPAESLRRAFSVGICLFSQAASSQVFSTLCGLNCRVRDGNGCTPTAIDTNYGSTACAMFRLGLLPETGSPCWTRTNDPAVNSRMLYRLS